MFAPLARFFNKAPDPAEIDRAFVAEIRVRRPREPRSRRSEIVLMAGWALILIKCAAVYWACAAYAVPINPWWVILPSVLFAAVCTWLYWRRE